VLWGDVMRRAIWRVLAVAGATGLIGWLARPTPRTAPHTALRYYLALPHGWNPNRSWPILVVVDGANHGHFLWNFLRFRWARRDLPFILIAPLVVSNGGHPDPRAYPYAPAVWDQVATQGAVPFDATGVLAIADNVRHRYHGEDTFWISGWSAGGHLSWQLILTHPERLAGAVLANANYAGRGVTTISTAPERIHLPINAFQGDRDPVFGVLNQQWATAAAQARAHGYTNLSHEIVTGGKHAPFPKQVFASLATYLPR